jgi:hypothetical protein
MPPIMFVYVDKYVIVFNEKRPHASIKYEILSEFDLRVRPQKP